MEPIPSRLPTEVRQAAIVGAVLRLAATRSPATITTGLVLMAILLSLIMGWYLLHFENEMAVLRGAA